MYVMILNYIYGGEEERGRETNIYHLLTHRFKKEETKVNSQPLCSLPNYTTGYFYIKGIITFNIQIHHGLYV